jgi:hypothetical protein
MLPEKIEHLSRAACREQIVSVDEADDFAAHVAKRAVDGIRLARVLLAANGVPIPRERTGDLQRSIRGAAVLKPPAQVRSLRVQGFQGAGEEFLGIENRKREHELVGVRAHGVTGSGASSHTFHWTRGQTTPGHCSGKFDA